MAGTLVESGLSLAALAAAGLLSGFASGLFGVGGGIVRIPLLLVLFPWLGIDGPFLVHLVQGTSLALAVPAMVSATREQWRRGAIDRALARDWLPPLVGGVLIGVVLSRFASGAFLKQAFSVAMAVAGVQLLRRRPTGRVESHRPSALMLGLAALPLGALSTFLGLTGGSFNAPVLIAMGVGVHQAVALSTLSGVPISVIGALGAIWNGLSIPGLPAHALGYVDLLTFAVMLPGAVAAAPLGVRIGHRLGEQRLSRLFGGFLLIVALDMAR